MIYVYDDAGRWWSCTSQEWRTFVEAKVRGEKLPLERTLRKLRTRPSTIRVVSGRGMPFVHADGHRILQVQGWDVEDWDVELRRLA